jgi:hypothetical protein
MGESEWGSRNAEFGMGNLEWGNRNAEVELGKMLNVEFIENKAWCLFYSNASIHA